MLSALVYCPAPHDHKQVTCEAIVRTLGALVPAIVEGILRDVVIVAVKIDFDLQHIADHAGCALIDANAPDHLFQQGIKAIRGRHVFVLRAGLIAESGFADELADCLVDRMASALMREQPQSLIERLLPNLAPVGGVLVSKEALLSQASMLKTGTSLAPFTRLVNSKKVLRSRLRRAQ
jgi:hypothetical protein